MKKFKLGQNHPKEKERNLTGWVHMGLYSLLFLPNGA